MQVLIGGEPKPPNITLSLPSSSFKCKIYPRLIKDETLQWLERSLFFVSICKNHYEFEKIESLMWESGRKGISNR